jgi:PAS domain S-box-containing protein
MARFARRIWRADTVLWLLLASLLMLPVVMLSSLSGATVSQMKLQADEISTLASGIRAYYADNVIERLQAADGRAAYADNYREVHGGIPIPATLSIELGALFDNAHSDGRISYEFISDYPFAQRITHPLDPFQRDALQAFRQDPSRKTYSQLIGNGLGRSTYRLATPILMRAACVTCHNSHPDSPKRDWKVGEVRGIQEVSVRGMQAEGFGNISSLFAYVGLVGFTSVAVTNVFRQRGRRLEQLNHELMDSSQRESSLSSKLAEQLQELTVFGNVVDDSVVGICIADMRRPDCPLIYVNKAFTELTGYSRDLAVGYNCRFLQGPDTDPHEIERMRAALAAGLPYRGEIVNYRADGTRFWNQLTLYPLQIGEGRKPDFYVSNQVDVSTLRADRQAASDEWEQQLQPLQADLGQVQQAIAEAEHFSDVLKRFMEHADNNSELFKEAAACLSASHKANNCLQALSKQLDQLMIEKDK